ncbi:MAG: hypothetical protein M3Y81_01095 [Chloroflexota bacterium]|nr:hypothetical protein [Chloroflexota bacterium]
MIDQRDRERLLRFRDSVIVPLANTDADKWPIRSGRISRLCLDAFSREFFADLQELQQRGMSLEQCAALFGNPSHLWRMSHHLLNGLRLLSTPLEAQQQAMLALLDMIASLKYGDPFCSDGSNCVWSPGQAMEEAAALPAQPPVEENARTSQAVHRLAGMLWAYAESLYFVAHEISVEIHGPYRLPNGQQMLVRDFFNLHPCALWPEVHSLLTGYGTVRILTAYRQFHAHLDVYNNLYLDPGVRLADETTASVVLLGGRPAGIAQIERLIQETGHAIKDISGQVDAWSLEHIARHYIAIFWWRKAALREALHENWRPPQDVLDRVAAGKIADPATSNPPLEALRQQYDLLS